MRKTLCFFITMLLIPLLSAGAASAAEDTIGSIVQFNTDIVIPEGHTVNGDVVVIIGNIEVLGTVNGDVVSVLGDIKIGNSGRVRGDTVAVLGSLASSIGSIQGSRVSFVGSDGFKNINLPNWSWQVSRPFIWSFHYGSKLIGLAFQILLTVLLVYFLPRPVRRIETNIRRNFLAAGGIGLLTMAAGVFAIFFFAITIIGIPLALLLGVLLSIVCLVAKYLGGAAIGLWVGQAILRDSQPPVVSALIGSLLVGAFLLIPFTGIIGMIVGLVGLGGVIATGFGTKGDESYA